MLSSEYTAIPSDTSDEKKRHLVIELTLGWFRRHDIRSAYHYHAIQRDVIQAYEEHQGEELQDTDLDTFDQVLHSLETLGYGSQSRDALDLFSRLFLVQRVIDLTLEQVLWHFKMKQCAGWLHRWLTRNRGHPELRNGLTILRHRLLKCKCPSDFENFTTILTRDPTISAAEATLIIEAMKTVGHLYPPPFFGGVWAEPNREARF